MPIAKHHFFSYYNLIHKRKENTRGKNCCRASRLTTKKGLISGSPWCVPFKEWMKNGG
jgi:hypothetical protein